MGSVLPTASWEVAAQGEILESLLEASRGLSASAGKKGEV